MEIRSDTEHNMAYIAFRKIRAGESAKQYEIKDRDGEVLAVVDFAAGGELLGIELFDARNQLPRM